MIAQHTDRFRALYRNLERAIVDIEEVEDVSSVLGSVLERLCREFEDDLGFEGGRIYRREGDDFVLSARFGTSQEAPIGLRVPRDYPPHQRLLDEGLVLMSLNEPGVDTEFEDTVGVRSKFAAMAVGSGTDRIGRGRRAATLHISICDRDRKWSDDVRRQRRDSGIRFVTTPERAPNTNVYVERFVRSIKEECLHRLIPISQRHFRHAVAEQVEPSAHQAPPRSPSSARTRLVGIGSVVRSIRPSSGALPFRSDG